MTQKQLVTSKFQAKSLKTRIEYPKCRQNSTKNEEKFIPIDNKNTQLLLLFLATFRFTKKLF